MTEQELLLHRFVDGDLSPEERLQFFEALDQDAALRQRLLEIEMLLTRAAQLPRLSPPHGLVARIQAALPSTSSGWFNHLRAHLHRTAGLNWNLGQAVALACGIFAVGLGLGLALHPSPTVQAPVLTADAGRTVFVRFALLQPDAVSVAIAGDFNGWDPQRTPLRRSESGLWTLTIPLKPGRYTYMYVVNGQRWVADPFASEFSADGFGAENAVVDVGESL